MQKFYILTQLT